MHVAIIEDDPAIAKAVRTAVREAGHECTWIPDGETAIRDQTILSSDMVGWRCSRRRGPPGFALLSSS
jgi:DNA-binding response OmpR family regulator